MGSFSLGDLGEHLEMDLTHGPCSHCVSAVSCVRLRSASLLCIVVMRGRLTRPGHVSRPPDPPFFSNQPDCSPPCRQVVLTPEASATAAEGKCNGLSPWRVSSTVFVHIASDVVLQPLGHFLTKESHLGYPTIAAGEQVRWERGTCM